MTEIFRSFADLGRTNEGDGSDCSSRTRRFFRDDGKGGATSTRHYRATEGGTEIYQRPTSLASVPPAPRPGDHRDICPGNPENTERLARYAEVTRELSAAELANSEAQNAAHIRRLIEHFASPQAAQLLTLFGIDPEAFERNLVRTDIGKIRVMSEDLAETKRGRDPTHIDRAFPFLCGRKADGPGVVYYPELYKRGQTILSDVIAEISGVPKPADGKPLALLNPNLSVQDLRDLFKQYPIMRSVMHCLPGLNSAINKYITGNLREDEFQSACKTILLHNGPEKGFWKFLINVLLPKNAAEKLFKGGMYWNNAENKMFYHTPVHPEGLLSAAVDRLDQGMAGVAKILFEGLGNFNLRSVKEQLFGANQLGTLEQLAALTQRTNDLLTEYRTRTQPNAAGEPATRLAVPDSSQVEVLFVIRRLVSLYTQRLKQFQAFVNDPKNLSLETQELADGNHKLALVFRYQNPEGNYIKDTFSAVYRVDASQKPDVYIPLGGEFQRTADGHLAEPSTFAAGPEGHAEMMKVLAMTAQDFIAHEHRVNGDPATITQNYAGEVLAARARMLADVKQAAEPRTGLC